MKKIILVSFTLATTLFSFAQNSVGIGTTSPDHSAALDIRSTTKGLLIPRMTTAERTAIVSPGTGLLVFDNSTNTFWFHNGNAWAEISGTGGGSSQWTTNGNDIYNNNSGNTGIGTLNPVTTLDVNSSSAHTARFNSGSNQMYVGFFENNFLRGYVGSYSGAAEDFDIGTGGINNTGKLHLTIKASPKMTIDNTGSVGIANTAPDASAILDINSTTKGLLVPRMTTAERTAINAPAKGLMVFDNTTNTFWFYNGTAWAEMSGSGGGSLSMPFAATDASAESFKVTNTVSGGTAIYGKATSTNPNSVGISGEGSGGSSVGVRAKNTGGFAIYAEATPIATLSPVIKGISNSATLGVGVMGESNGVNGRGLYGSSTAGTGVEGYGNNAGSIGVKGNSLAGIGVKAYSFSGTALDVEGNIKIAGGNTTPGLGKVLTSDANGNATWKTPVFFKGFFNIPSTYNVAENTWVTVPLNEVYDIGGNNFFPNGSATNPNSFVAPVAGYYEFGGSVEGALWSSVYNIATAAYQISVNGSSTIFGNQQWAFKNGSSSSNCTLHIHDIIYLNAGDVVKLQVQQTNINGLTAQFQTSMFTGKLLYQN